ncbi:meiotically up-regulated 71 protein [Ophiocordyceps camponoti-floridani]|uniref:Diphthine--ammonia ligase n=1 Tax=Ophiocordyceps camponoti-floridani TaxID=2030778 RepID=A0A8H4VG94_9HYPO|nr:meiotically up-regulated 71 protein [Ophiocordyceps camponoti-floridani]
MAGRGLNVIALVSGGKDGFFSLLHCLQNGHVVVALANLYPGDADAAAEVEAFDPSDADADAGADAEPCRSDPDSFMYQTVGHQVVPLYAAATGIPLYRMAIRGRAACRERDYGGGDEGDETEAMVPLLRAIMERHPCADGLCSGAILSTYQRTRVESVALRLGLTPLSYLWKYPVLDDDDDDGAQLLRDMAEAGLDARIVKVASGGLDGSHLWERVTSVRGMDRIGRAVRREVLSSFTTWCFAAESVADTIEEETAEVVNKVRIALSESGREPTNTVVLLRDMSDFSTVNQQYGSLFTRPIPPSRVTISCGDMLPPGRRIIISVTVKDGGANDRLGLHVQSRSYWAPANIGPYSQAVDVGMAGPRAVLVAGQIPLVPATMALPGDGWSWLGRAVLSLQHLWRVGREMGVQFWTSAVAYVPRGGVREDEVRMTGEVWRLLHKKPADEGQDGAEEDGAEEDGAEEDGAEEVGPDLWEAGFDRREMRLGRDEGLGSCCSAGLDGFEDSGGAAGVCCRG